MEASLIFCVLTESISFFIPVSCIIVFIRHRIIIQVHKIIARVIWRVNIYHLDLAYIGILEQFQHFEIIALDIEILRGVPIYRLFLARTQSLTNRRSRLL